MLFFQKLSFFLDFVCVDFSFNIVIFFKLSILVLEFRDLLFHQTIILFALFQLFTELVSLAIAFFQLTLKPYILGTVRNMFLVK